MHIWAHLDGLDSSPSGRNGPEMGLEMDAEMDAEIDAESNAVSDPESSPESGLESDNLLLEWLFQLSC